jgi:queuine tRNA-ribosyltransferase
VFRRVGGIHKFMSWERSVLTDSGGYQIFSLPHSRSMGEEGAVFQSYIDGRTIMLSPEVSIETQKAIGSDIMMALDHCVASTADESTARAAMEITHRWAARSLAARGRFAAGDVRDRARRARAGAAAGERGVVTRVAVRWLCNRRARGW